MTRKNSGGYVGLVVLAIVGLVAVGTSVYLYMKPTVSPIVEKMDNSSQLANVITALPATTTEPVATTTTTQTITTPITYPTVSESAPKKVVTTAPVVTPKVTPVAVVPKPVVTPEPVKVEPMLVVAPGTQPAPTLLLGYAYDVPFTVVELTAVGQDVTVNTLTIERQGTGSDRLFTEIGVEGVDVERAPNSLHRYTTHNPFTIKAGETREIVLFGNITDKDTLVDYEGQTPKIALVDIQADTKISGALPVVGTAHTANPTIEIGSIELSKGDRDPNTNLNVYINDTNVIFSAIRGDVSGAESVSLTSFAFLQNGTAGSGDITNVNICLIYKASTNCYPVETPEDGKTYSVDFPEDVVIGKGESFQMYIKGDLLPSGVNRTVDFDVNTGADLLAYGLTYNNYILSYDNGDEGAQPEGTISVSDYPFYNAYAHTIHGGTAVSIGKP